MSQYIEDLNNLTRHIVDGFDLETLKKIARNRLRSQYANDDELFNNDLAQWKSDKNITTKMENLVVDTLSKSYRFTLRTCDIRNPVTGLTTFGFELSDGINTYYDHTLVYSLSYSDDSYRRHYDRELLEYALRNKSYEMTTTFDYIKDNKEDLIINGKTYHYEGFLDHYFWKKEENLL